MTIIDELSVMYAKIGEHENAQSTSKEADSIEAVLQAIEKAETMIQAVLKKKPTDNTVETISMPPQAQTLQSSVTLQAPAQQPSPTGVQNVMTTAWPFYQKLKPLEIPVFDGSKAKFQDFWALFSSLVDNSTEGRKDSMCVVRR